MKPIDGAHSLSKKRIQAEEGKGRREEDREKGKKKRRGKGKWEAGTRTFNFLLQELG